MSAANTAALVLGLTALLACNGVAIALMYSLHSQSDNMLVKARSPAIAMLQGTCSLVLLDLIVVQQIMQQYGAEGFPCGALLWGCAFALPLIQESLFLRALRVVVMTDAECRLEDTNLISREGSAKHLVRCGLVSLCIAAYYHFMASQGDLDKYYCYAMQPWPLFLGLQIITTVNATIISRALVEAKDGLRMAAEIRRCFIYIYAFTVPYYVLLALNSAGVISAGTELNLLLVPACVGLLLETFVASRKVWAARSRRTRIYSDVEHDAGDSADDAARYTCTRALMQSPIMKAAYGRFIERNLCYESFQFLEATTAYAALSQLATPKEQFKAFNAIVMDFILPGSKYEVNIDTKMRVQITRLQSDDMFLALTLEERYRVFSSQISEVSKLLDLNLVGKFRLTPEFATARLADEKLLQASRKETRSFIVKPASGGLSSPKASRSSRHQGSSHKVRSSRGLFSSSGSSSKHRRSEASLSDISTAKSADASDELDQIEQKLIEFHRKEQESQRVTSSNSSGRTRLSYVFSTSPVTSPLASPHVSELPAADTSITVGGSSSSSSTVTGKGTPRSTVSISPRSMV